MPRPPGTDLEHGGVFGWLAPIRGHLRALWTLGGRRGPEGQRLSTRRTLLFAVLWAGLVVHGWSDLILGDGGAWLSQPAASAGRLTSRDLDLASVVDAVPGTRGRVWAFFYGSEADALGQALWIYADLLSQAGGKSPDFNDGSLIAQEEEIWAAAQLAVLEAESGRPEAGLATLDHHRELEPLASALHTAYGLGSRATGDESREPQGEDPLLGVDELPLEPWMRDRLGRSLALAIGDEAAAEAREAAILERGSRWLRRSRAMFAANALLAALGLGVLFVWILPSQRPATGPAFCPPWTLADGLGVLVRADFYGRLYYVGLGMLDADVAHSSVGTVLFDSATLFASLPLAWLTLRHLLLPHRRSAPDPFGLDLRTRRLSPLFGVALAAIGVDLVGSYVLGWSAWSLGIDSHWSEGLDEALLWGHTAALWLTCLDYVGWAPVFEELAFRGLLYFSLRRRYAPATAALISAAAFGALHFYSLPGFLTTCLSGFVWAVAFERARSLLPAIAAHSVYNVLYVAGLLLVYRLPG